MESSETEEVEGEGEREREFSQENPNLFVTIRRFRPYPTLDDEREEGKQG